MRGAVLLLIAVIFCGLARVSEGTICTSRTLSTCKKSLLMTGRCVDGVCECVSSDYTPGPFGCQTKPKSQIKAEGNGYIQTGAGATVRCTKGVGECKWFKDGVLMKNKKSIDISAYHWTTDMSGVYTCMCDIAGIQSDESDPLHVIVADTFTTKLEVRGMPTALVPGMAFRLDCITHVAYASDDFEWRVGGKAVPGGNKYGRYIHTVSTDDAGKSLKCTLPNAEDSDEVVFPDRFTTDIDGVEIIGSSTVLMGDQMKLLCKLTGGFPQPDPDNDYVIRFQWKQNDEIMEYETGDALSLYSDATSGGTYTCEATAGSNPTKVSPPFTLKVINKPQTLGYKDIIVSSPNFLKDSYVSMTCDYDAMNTSQPVKYSWSLCDVKLDGVTDKTIQINGAEINHLLIWTMYFICDVTNGDDSMGSMVGPLNFDSLSEIKKDVVDLKAPSKIGVGIPLTFKCVPKLYYTPGMIYYWSVGSIMVQSGYSNTFVITPESDERMEIKCKYSFSSVFSQETTSTFLPKYIYSVAILSNGFNVKVLQPVAGTTVKLMCDVSKSEGVGPVSYRWKQGSSVLIGATEQYYQAEVGPVPKMISCTATIASKNMTSEPIRFAPQTYAATPFVSLESDCEFKREGKVIMLCLSTSHAEGSTYEWTKDRTVVIKDQTSYKYTIDHVAQTDEGDYSCMITVGGQTSNASDVAELKTFPNEKTCTWASDCKQPNMNTTICYHGNCECSSGFTMKGGECSSWLHPEGGNPKSAPIRGHLGSLLFRPEAVDDARVDSSSIDRKTEDLADPQH